MILLVDIGNSRIKWACWRDRELHAADAVPYTPASLQQQLDDCWQSIAPPQQVQLCSVVSPETTAVLVHWVQSHWQLEPQIASVQKQAYSVHNAYAEPERLGIDRWLALLALRQQTKKTACVIDCGTAITLDVLHADGRHLGGVILPGMRLMQQSLHTASTAIRQTTSIESSADPDTWLAQSTTAAVASGCRLAAVGAIEQLRDNLQTQFDDSVEFVITGGDAVDILPSLSFRPRHDPLLVLRGLAVNAGLMS